MVETMGEVNTSWLHRVSAKRRTVDIEEQRSIAWRGLQEYLRTVSLRGCAREEKLQRIADLFTVDAALITPGGEVLEGHEGVKQFYGSDESPVMQRADFMPRPVNGTLRFSLDGRSLSIEIDLPSPTGEYGSYVRVFDRFTFDTEGLITKLSIVDRGSCYAPPLSEPRAATKRRRVSPLVVAAAAVACACGAALAAVPALLSRRRISPSR